MTPRPELTPETRYDDTRSLLGLLLLACGPHFLVESSVRDLQAGHGGDTNIQNRNKNEGDKETHEESWGKVLISFKQRPIRQGDITV